MFKKIENKGVLKLKIALASNRFTMRSGLHMLMWSRRVYKTGKFYGKLVILWGYRDPMYHSLYVSFPYWVKSYKGFIKHV